MNEPTPKKPVRRRYRPITTIESLQEHLQWAVSTELSTIPPYLAALYSIQDNTSEAFRSIRSVVFEEMLHMMLASNMLNAVGRSPLVTGDFAPTYPGYMKHHAAGGPFIQIQAYSASLMSVTFMAIEQPEPSPRAPAEGDEFHTLGQFYKAIEEGFVHCVDRYTEKGVFGRDTGFQARDTYFGLGGGHLFEVKNLADAKRAINEIVQQGEGAAFPRAMPEGEDRYGGKDHYGDRPDGTFGPILGTPWEMSHYRKFEKLASAADQPAVWPMAANPGANVQSGFRADLAKLFDQCYSIMLGALERAFGSAQQQRYFFGAAFPLMQYALAPLANLLVQTPLISGADPSVGPNAGPPFRYRPGATVEAAIASAEGRARALRGGVERRRHRLRDRLAIDAGGRPHRAPQRGSQHGEEDGTVMTHVYKIHPSIGVMRVGDSEEYYLGPETAGGLPILPDGGAFGPRDFRDAEGKVRRQAARFRVYRYDPARPDDPGVEVLAGQGGVRSIGWKVHLANKKAIWYEFQTLLGESGYSPDHPLRNPSDTDPATRVLRIIDAGPRTLTGPNQSARFARNDDPDGYPMTWPPEKLLPASIDALGQMHTDAEGRLVVVGGYGCSGSSKPPVITHYANNDDWWDDTSDGPVTAWVILDDGTPDGLRVEVQYPAWVITAPPGYAPQVENLVTLYDTMFDVAVRRFGTRPDIYRDEMWQRGYEPDFDTEIAPVLRRGATYPWVAAIPPHAHRFDMESSATEIRCSTGSASSSSRSCDRRAGPISSSDRRGAGRIRWAGPSPA
ncbi:MAG: LodA/GoxA family CTQ-dependent oxidase [Minicystis sp.]